MPRKTPEEVVFYANRAWELKRPYYGLWWECWAHAAPGLNPFATGNDPEYASAVSSPNAGHYSYLFDSTVARATESTPHRMTEEMFPPGRNWADLNPGSYLQLPPDTVITDKELVQVVEVGQQRLYANLHASKILLELVKMNRDAFVSGTGVLKMGMSPTTEKMLHFEAINQAQVAFEPGPMGLVWGYYRKAEMIRDHLIATWPDAYGVPAEPLGEKDNNMPPKWKVVEATYHDYSTGMWYMDVILQDNIQGSSPVRIVERDLPVCPWACYRYSLLSGEVQGRSPVMAALPDARVLNHAKKVRLESASMRVAGMYTFLNDGTFNPRTARLRSGAFIPVGSNDSANPTIRPLDVSGDIQLGEIIIEDLQEDIKMGLGDFALPDPGGAVRSATEIIERAAEVRQKRGIPYLRMMEEVGVPVLRAALWFLSEAGQMPELDLITGQMADGRPKPLMLDGTDLQVQFTSPHVQAQQLSDAQTIVQWAEASQRAAGMEGWLAGAKVEDIPEVLAKMMRVPADLYRSKEERAERLQMAMEAQQGQAQPQQDALPSPEGMMP